VVFHLSLLAHLVGDYVLQNHWMANRKTSSWTAACVHAALYTLPFTLLTQNLGALAVIGGTHAVIDRLRLAKVWVDFWGVGTEGRVIGAIMGARGYRLTVYRNEHGHERGWVDARHEPERRVPHVQDAPPFLGVWLVILVDNTLHLCINTAALWGAS
jgi:hypothetical protein